MPQRLKLLVLLLSAAGAVGLLAAANATASKPDPCQTQVNDTSAKLLPCIRTADLWNHMQKLQAIADANPGPDGHPSRNSGEPGYEGNVPSFDGGCVDNPFRWCDNLSNNDPKVLTFMSKAFATMVVQMAFDTKVMSASNNTVINKKLPIAAEAGRHSVAK
jgi:hypothetical protein